MKYCIYNCKFNNCKPSHQSFFYKFKFKIQVEKHISSKESANSKKRVTLTDLENAFNSSNALFA